MDQDLTLEQLKSGRLAALRNAEEVLSDAELLCEHGKWARSVFLSQIAVEELGKYIMFVSATLYSLTGLINWKRFRKELRDHKRKFGNVLLEEYFWNGALIRGTENADKRVPPSQYLKDIPSEKEQNNNIKMLSLYSDLDEDKFVCPSDLPFEQLAKILIELAKQRLEHQRWYENNVMKDVKLENVSKEVVFEMWQRMGVEDVMRDRW